MERKLLWMGLLACLALPAADAGAQPSPTATERPPPPWIPVGHSVHRDYPRLVEQGRSALLAEKYGEAAAAYRKALALEPESPDARAGLGIALVHAGCTGKECGEALALLEQAVQIRKDNAQAWLSLGMAYQRANRNQDAATAYRKYLELIRAGRTADDVREVLSELESGPREGPNPKPIRLPNEARPPPAPLTTPTECWHAGIDRFRGGRYGEAESALNRCLTLDPKFAPCHMALGSVYVMEGKSELGAREYRTFLQLTPDAPEAAGVRRSLEEYERRRTHR